MTEFGVCQQVTVPRDDPITVFPGGGDKDAIDRIGRR